MSPVSLMGAGFIGGNYARLYPDDTVIEPRESVVPTQPDTLFTRSTTTNYLPLQGDLKTDIQTNLLHLADVLPNVRGTFTFLSSWFAAVGGDWGHHPAFRSKEHHLSRPNGFYSSTKLCAEQLIRSYVETVEAFAFRSDVPAPITGPAAYRILRLCNVIGNDPRAGRQKGALEWLLSKVVANEDVPLYEEAEGGVRDILHVDDVCRAIRLCIEKGDLNTTYNVGRGHSHSMEDLIRYAIERTGSTSRIVKVPVPAFHRVVQTPRFYMDTPKLRALGFEPQYSVWESVDKVLESLLRAEATRAVTAYTDHLKATS